MQAQTAESEAKSRPAASQGSLTQSEDAKSEAVMSESEARSESEPMRSESEAESESEAKFESRAEPSREESESGSESGSQSVRSSTDSLRAERHSVDREPDLYEYTARLVRKHRRYVKRWISLRERVKANRGEYKRLMNEKDDLVAELQLFAEDLSSEDY